MEKEFKLTPVHPFTDRQAEIIQLMLAGVTNIGLIAEELKIAENTVNNHIHGKDTSAALKAETLTIDAIGKTDLGIFGIIEVLTGKRPARRNLLGPLFGDVILEANAILA